MHRRVHTDRNGRVVVGVMKIMVARCDAGSTVLTCRHDMKQMKAEWGCVHGYMHL